MRVTAGAPSRRRAWFVAARDCKTAATSKILRPMPDAADRLRGSDAKLPFAAAEAEHVDVFPRYVPARQHVDKRNHCRIIGPNPAVEQFQAAEWKRTKKDGRRRCRERRDEHLLMAVDLVIGMMRRLEYVGTAVRAISRRNTKAQSRVPYSE